VIRKRLAFRTQEKYSEFVQARIGNPSNWDDLESQSLLGIEGFAGGTPAPSDRKATDSRDTEGSTIRRPAEFGEATLRGNRGKASRDRLIAEGVTAHGYSQMEVSSLLGLHYSMISRILAADKGPNPKT
jgi:hypothetical protein